MKEYYLTTKTKALSQLYISIQQDEACIIRFNERGSDRTHTLNYKSEVPEFFVDDNGIKWRRVLEGVEV